MRIRFYLLAFWLVYSAGTRCFDARNHAIHDVREDIIKMLMIKQLDKAADLLEQLEVRHVFSKMCSQLSSHTCKIFENEATFLSDDIAACQEKIQITRSLKPFLELWAQQKSDFSLLTVSHLKEIAVLILTIYRAIYTACTPILQSIENEYKKSAFQAIAVLFSNIASLQAFELLTIIDKLTVQIPKLLEKYEITTGTLTWKEWITKYWWLPPMAIAAIILECAFIYQVATGSKKLPATALKTATGLFSKQEKETTGQA